MGQLISLTLGIAWLAMGYRVGARRIRRASMPHVLVMLSYSPTVTILTFAVTSFLWPIMGELG